VSKIRFYLDENVANVIAEGLRTQSIEVLTTPEADHMGWSDEQHLNFAREQNYVFITQDDDLLTLARKIEHAGIVYYKQQTRSPKQILQGLFTLHREVLQEEMQNVVRFL
jgi:predicted nuclease of predicted toxin-antitoxin system